MTKVRVNKDDVELLEKASNKMLKKDKELISMNHDITSLISTINNKKNEINDQISQIKLAISNISTSINNFKTKLEEVENKLDQAQAKLRTTPKTIITEFGELPNPQYFSLCKQIASLEAYKIELRIMTSKCSSHKSELENRKSVFESTISELNDKVCKLENYKKEIGKIKEKLVLNSQKAEYLLKKIATVIDTYISVRVPVTDFNYVKSSIVNNVNTGKLILGKNGSFWTKEMGNYGEMRTSIEFQQDGFFEMTKSPTSLNDKLTHGIDHIFYKEDKFYIVDSKSGPGAHLESKTATGPQLSDAWIDARLDGSIGKEAADIIREKMIIDSESIIRLVSRVDVGKQTIYGLVDSFGKIIKEAITINELFI